MPRPPVALVAIAPLIHPSNLKLCRMKWYRSSIMWYLLGLLLFYHMADFSNPVWGHLYYVWDKGKDVLLLVALAGLAPKHRKQILPVIIFSIIRLLWEVAAWLINQNINGSKVIDYLFLLCLVVYLWPFIKESKEWQK